MKHGGRCIESAKGWVNNLYAYTTDIYQVYLVRVVERSSSGNRLTRNQETFGSLVSLARSYLGLALIEGGSVCLLQTSVGDTCGSCKGGPRRC